MVFIQMTGGKSKRLKGRHGGDKYGWNERSRRDSRRYDVENKRSAERKSSRRERHHLLDTTLVSTSVAPAVEAKPKSRNSFVTDDGSTRVTIRYNAEGIAVGAYIRPTGHRR